MSDIMNYQFQNPMQTFLAMSQFGAGLQQQREQGVTARINAMMLERKLAAEQAQAEAQAIQQEKINALMGRLRQPGATRNDYLELAMFLPKDQAKAVQDSVAGMRDEERAAALNESAQIYSASLSGDTDLFAGMLRRQAAAERAVGNEEGALTGEAWARLAESANPEEAERARIIAGLQLAVHPDGREAMDAILKQQEERRKAAAEPDAIKKRLADIGFTEAQTNKLNVEARKLGLEADKIANDVEAAKKALPPAREISAGAEKIVNDSVIAAAKAKALTSQYDILARDFDAAIRDAGVGARITESVRRVLGTEKEPTALRQEYLRMRNTAVLEMLPPGVASDKDVELALAAFPTETSSPQNIAGFLRGMAKLQAYEGAVNDAKAEWVQQNGTLGTATVPMQVGGRTVRPGERFSGFIAAYIPNTSVLNRPQPAGGAATPQPVEEVDL
jgi:hypothetical protein